MKIYMKYETVSWRDQLQGVFSNLKHFILFCRLSSLLVMLGSVRKDVESIRNGLHQIIPKKLLQPLNAEVCQILHDLLNFII